MTVSYRLDVRPTAAQYIDLLERAGIAHRRPVDQPDVIQAALDGSQVVVTAWEGDTLVGALRAITDFHLHCYVGEIAVDPSHQRLGLGLEMQRAMRAQLAAECKVRLSSTPHSASYYSRLGYTPVELVWELIPGAPLG